MPVARAQNKVVEDKSHSQQMGSSSLPLCLNSRAPSGANSAKDGSENAKVHESRDKLVVHSYERLTRTPQEVGKQETFREQPKFPISSSRTVSPAIGGPTTDTFSEGSSLSVAARAADYCESAY